MKKIVSTKKELEDALEEKAEVIVVEKELAKDLKPMVELMKLSPAQVTAITGFIATSGALLVGSLVAMPVTGGISGLTAAAATASATAAVAASSGVAVSIIAGIVVVAVVIGVSLLLDLLKDYDVVEYEISGAGITFRRKAVKN